jgi:outer membrane protein assembly factor BamB
MKFLVLCAVLVALGIVLFICVPKPAAPGAPSPSGKGGERRAGLEDRAGWVTYHGGYSLDGVAGTPVPDAPERLWKFKAGNRVEATPVSAEGRIHFTSVKGGLFAVDPGGSLVWKITIEPDSFTSPPLLAGGKIIVGSSKGLLRAFDAATGGEKWSYDVGGTVQGTANGIDLPGGKKGVFAISQSDGSIHAVDLETGKGAWKTPPMQRCDGSAGVGGGWIVMGSCAAALHVFSVDKAEKTSDVPLGRDNEVAGGVAMSGSFAFAGTRSGKLCAVDVAAGKVVWTNGDGSGEAFATPAVSDKAVVFGADDGKAYGLKRDTGEKLWSFDSGNRPLSPVIAGERVVLSSGGSLFLLDLMSGKKLWSAAVSDDITSPAVVAGMILVGGDDGTVTAYGRK